MRDSHEFEPLLLVQSFTYDGREDVLASLSREVNHCGAWLLGHRAVSATSLQVHLEVQSRDLLEVYAALLTSGLELTRAAHLALANACALSHYARTHCCETPDSLQRCMSTLCLEIIFLPDPLDSADLLHRLALHTVSA